MLFLEIILFLLAGASLLGIFSTKGSVVLNIAFTLGFVVFGIICRKKRKSKKNQGANMQGYTPDTKHEGDSSNQRPEKRIVIVKEDPRYRPMPAINVLSGSADQSKYMERVSVKTSIDFVPIKKVGGSVLFSNTHFAVPQMINKKAVIIRNKVYDVNEVIGYEVLEDGKTITSGGLGSAILGGALFGGAGAIVGSITGGKTTSRKVNSLRLKLTLNNIVEPVLYIDFLPGILSYKSDSFVCRQAYSQVEEAVSIFQILQHRKEGK